jgi:hypothetical protein
VLSSLSVRTPGFPCKNAAGFAYADSAGGPPRIGQNLTFPALTNLRFFPTLVLAIIDPSKEDEIRTLGLAQQVPMCAEVRVFAASAVTIGQAMGQGR